MGKGDRPGRPYGPFLQAVGNPEGISTRKLGLEEYTVNDLEGVGSKIRKRKGEAGFCKETMDLSLYTLVSLPSAVRMDRRGEAKPRDWMVNWIGKKWLEKKGK